MTDANKTLSMRDKIIAVLQGKKPDRLPFIDRMELWGYLKNTLCRTTRNTPVSCTVRAKRWVATRTGM